MTQLPRAFALAFLAAVLAACVPAATQTPFTETLAADSPRATPGGSTFTAPAGWSISTGASLVILTPPEGDSRMAIVDVEAKDAAQAAAVAWQAYRPDAKRPLKIVTDAAPFEGWEERHAFVYETSPNERVTVFAVTQRAGSMWAVTIVDAALPTFGKRSSQFLLAFSSLRPKGYQRESFAGRAAHRLDAGRIAILKAFVEDGMQKLGVPGVGLALIDGGKVVYEGGVGVRELGKPDKVDADTLFLAASNTKALTTLLLAELVDEKKLRWDEAVTEAYPRFKLGDAATTKSVLVKHLVCACTGMPRQDLEWLFEFGKATPASTLDLLGTMQPTTRFGQLYQYSNLMAAAAGYVGGAVASPGLELGAAYDSAMQRRVFAPLGMDRTTFDFARAQRGDHASPHAKDVEGVLEVAHMDVNYASVPVRPAGGVWTSARDLARYVQMELARGKLADGKRLVSEENLLARRAPQVQMSEDVHYGMGLIIDKRWGVTVIHHGGDLPGYHSDMMWFPDHGVGAVILTNSDQGGVLRSALLRRIAEVLFDGKPEAQPALDAAARTMEAVRRKERERLVIPADPALAARLARRYVSPQLGSVDVEHRGKDIVFDVGEWKSAVASRRNDDGTVSFITIDPAVEGFQFVVADREGRRALMMRDAQHEYAFVEAGS